VVEQSVEDSAHARTLTPKLHTVHVTDDLNGWVVVVGGEDPALADVARAGVAAGAAVGVVSKTLDDATPSSVRFRADPGDPDAWARIAMHIEQHLGPVDGVVTDASSHDVVNGVFAVDLSRRGRSQVIVVGAGESPARVITALFGTPPAEPSRPAVAEPDP